MGPPYTKQSAPAPSTLATFTNESLDFVIACHVLEHVPSFLGTLQTFARVLRRGGVALIALPMALPDQRFNAEDTKRPTTTPETHLSEWHVDATRLASARVDHVAVSQRRMQLGKIAPWR
jgi:predicted SAM-dependent methyltransferase